MMNEREVMSKYVTVDDYMDFYRAVFGEEVKADDEFSQFKRKKEKEKTEDEWAQQYIDLYGYAYTPEYSTHKKKQVNFR
ncbi:hypothetical protein BAOM_3029 [Peribacillus asahii]|uniref:Uncharacterized protein n=1 Tax=Peribacillus asahii TaxID=228899 RepID=A0A3T0KTI4_9BACI|nr:hypothetical protein [Peribacillus asahii]AZV43638.1 hypothetical protein BAOM_3029 [Peribacillus asahii]